MVANIDPLWYSIRHWRIEYIMRKAKKDNVKTMK